MKKLSVLLGLASASTTFRRDADHHRGPGLCVNGHIAQGGGSPLDEKSVFEIGDATSTIGEKLYIGDNIGDNIGISAAGATFDDVSAA